MRERIVLSTGNTGDLYIRRLEDADDRMQIADLLWQGLRTQEGSSLAYWLSKLSYAANDGVVALLVKEVPVPNGPAVPGVVGAVVCINNHQLNALEFMGGVSYWDGESTTASMLGAVRAYAALDGRKLVKRVVEVRYDEV